MTHIPSIDKLIEDLVWEAQTGTARGFRPASDAYLRAENRLRTRINKMKTEIKCLKGKISALKKKGKGKK